MPIRVYYEVLNQKGTPALYSDNYAQRPAAGYQGRIFNSPDTGQIFYDTGTTWTLLADAGVGSGSLASVCANGNTTATGISITAGGLSTNSLTSTNLTAGSIPFIGTGGLFSQDNTNLFWDNTSKYLGINTNTPTAPFDVHITGNIGIQINNTATGDSKIAFLQSDVGKWRIGNLYSGGANLFHIYNNAGVTLAMQIDSTNAALFYGSLSANSFIQTNGGISLIHNAVPTSSGYTGIGGLTAGLSIALASGFNQTLTFPTGVAYTYTFPSATGTLINGTSFTSGVIPKYSSTAGVLTASMLTDDGTTLQSIGATRSNLYLKAANNTYYGQLAFTNGSNGSFGGISYNNASQYMQFETASSEWARLLSDGKLLINTTSSNGTQKLQVNGFTRSNGFVVAVTSTLSGYLLPQGEWTGVASNNLSLAAEGGNEITFYTNGSATEKMRINVSGKLNIGSNSTTYGTLLGVQTSSSQEPVSHFYNSRNVSGDRCLYMQMGSNARNASSYYLQCFDAIDVMYIYGNGNIVNTNGSYGTISDISIKENIVDATSKLDDILKLKVKNFNLINDENKTKQIGFIAQEFEEVFPSMIDVDGKSGNKTIKTSVLVPMLVKAIQELNDKIENLN